MNKNKLVSNMGLGACSIVLSLYACQDKERQDKPDKPNIVFILIDDLGWKDVGFMGSKYYETPEIDKLAQQGMIFTSAYSSAPNCAPTRACLMTGQYSPRHGIYTVNSSARGSSKDRKLIPVKNTTVLDTSFITIAEFLKNEGYKTISIGKWHLGKDGFGPLNQGFDINIGGNNLGHPKSYFSPYKNENISDLKEGEYLPDRLTNEAINFIKENKENPFFIYLPYYAVHTPLQAKDSIINKYRNKTCFEGQNNPVYAAMIESVDQGIGKILNTLDKLDLSKNTIVVFYSDNGGHGPTTSMTPLRGSKGMLYEGGIRVPLIFHWKGKISPGLSCDIPVTSVDFFPTLLEISEASIPDGHPVDGESLVPLFSQNGKIIREEIFWHFPAYLENYRGMEGKWRTTPAGAIRKGEWKLIEFFEDGCLELYNLEDDLGEQNNLAENNPEIKNELYQLMLDWRKVIQAPVPELLNPEYEESKIK